jgi:hypothetical protein
MVINVASPEVMLSLFCIGVIGVILDYIGQRGNRVINFKWPTCRQYGEPMPMLRKPTSWRQAMWGGWTCAECGFESDRRGRPNRDQNRLSKWAVLLAVVESEEPRRPQQRNERIREANDQTQRGNAS